MNRTPTTISFRFERDGTVSRSDAPQRESIPGQGYYLNDNPLAEGLSTAVDPRFADWLEIAHAVYLADRVVRRPWSYERDASAAWARRLHLEIPVRDRDFWRSETITAALLEVLSFLTEDVWSFDFLAGKLPRRSEGQRYLFESVSAPSEVALLSGGLDSFAGALIRRAALPNTHFVFVSGATNEKLRSRQIEQFRFVRRQRPDLATHISLRHHLVSPPPRRAAEGSQRSRGFLHLTLGCIAALTIKAPHLHVYENGLGAINLPLDGSQIGAFNSRPVNPATLIAMSRLAQIIGESRGFRIVNPFLFQTKAEMCAAEPTRAAGSILSRTISCDHPPRQVGHSHCGTCSSCVLRRLSFHASGLTSVDQGKNYECDIFAPDPMLSRRRWLALRKMRWQAGVLGRAIESSEPWLALAQKFWMLPRVASALRLSEERLDAEASLVSLYSRYVNEWRAFPPGSNFFPLGRIAA